MISSQFGILAPVPNHSRYLEFRAIPGSDLISVFRDMASGITIQNVVIGLGPGLVKGLGYSIEELRPFPALSGPGCEVPSTQADLWCWVQGDDRGAIVHQARSVTHGLRQGFSPVRVVDGFKIIGVST